MGNMAGKRCSSQASKIWLGEFGLASLPAARGYHGIKAIPDSAQISISRSHDRSRIL
jgi:hypothetical protein